MLARRASSPPSSCVRSPRRSKGGSPSSSSGCVEGTRRGRSCTTASVDALGRRHRARRRAARARRRSRHADRDRRDRPDGARAQLSDPACTAAWPTSRSSPARRSWRSATRASTVTAAWALGARRVHHPAARGLVLVRTPRRHPPHLRPDDPRARRGAGARRHGARRSRRARRRAGGRDGRAARLLACTSSTQLETAALLHHLGQVCLDEPDDGRPPEPAAVAQAGADDPPRHAAARTGRRHHRRRVDAATATSTCSVATVGDVGADPQGRERVRRARPTGTPTARPSRSKRCAPRPSTSTTRGCSRALEIVLDRRGLLARSARLSAASRLGQHRAGSRHAGCLRSTGRRRRCPITMSPIENCWFGTPGAVMTSPRNASRSSSSCGRCFTVCSIGTCTSRPARSRTSSLVGMPWFSAITSTLSATPIAMMSHAAVPSGSRSRTRGSRT